MSNIGRFCFVDDLDAQAGRRRDVDQQLVLERLQRLTAGDRLTQFLHQRFQPACVPAPSTSA